MNELLDIATEILNDAVAEFTGLLGAHATVHKSAKDFATDADLAIERHLTARLTERTGIPVHGEEHGGPPLDNGTTWVLDPIDGTANFSLGLPLTATNLALVRDGVPVIGLTWAPLLHQRFAAVAGGQVLRNGEPVPALQRTKLADVAIAFGNVTANGGRRFPTGWRMALLDTLAERSLRVRVLGSTAVEAAWTAVGVTGGMIAFGNHPWVVWSATSTAVSTRWPAAACWRPRLAYTRSCWRHWPRSARRATTEAFRCAGRTGGPSSRPAAS
jgi:myo-inositol-1(or 4)-monophosphatase